jgi:hypothetical protein
MINKIDLSYNLVKVYLSPFLQNEAIKYVVKVWLCLQSFKSMPKKLPTFIAEISYIITIIVKVDFEK